VGGGGGDFFVGSQAASTNATSDAAVAVQRVRLIPAFRELFHHALYPAPPTTFRSACVWDAWGRAGLAFDIAAASRADAQALAQRQAHRLAALLQAAARGSPLYRRILAGRDPARIALADLPPMGKPELMGRFDDWVADPRLRLADLRRFTADPARIGEPVLGRYCVWESSGSSGEPGIFVQDPAALAVYELLEMLRRRLLQPLRRAMDPWGFGERFAFVGATTGHFASTAWLRRLASRVPWGGSRLQLHSFLQPPDALIAKLHAQAPTVLATYPSVAWTLAEHAAAGRLELSLRELWTGGESLTPAMRDFLSRTFGCPVAQSYGASECLALASECRCGRLHLNSDWVLLESVDADHRPVPLGHQGATSLLTNLANHVQPLIRYELGDRVRLCTDACPCGLTLPVIEVQGRSDDTLVLDDRSGRAVRLSPLALVTVLEEDAGVFDFRVSQTGRRALSLDIGATGPPAEASLVRAQAALQRFLRAQGLDGVRLKARCGVAFERGRSGKRQRVVARG
jgi:phenylacetate-CoA ligase